jgi:uncharacterized membrane protein YjjP (DUF1212 family)
VTVRHDPAGAGATGAGWVPAPDVPDRLLLRYARAAHLAGLPTDDLERRVAEMGRALGREVAVSATPTLVEVAIGAFPDQRTTTIRVEPRDVDPDTIARLDALARRVADGLPAPDALGELERLVPSRHHAAVTLAAFGAVGAAIAPILGGGWREAMTALMAGIAVGAVVLAGSRRDAVRAVVTPAAAVVAGLICALAAESGLDVAVDLATLAALVAILPGMALTVGIRELSTGHLQSGVANTAVALVQLVGLVFGVAVVRSLTESWFGPAPGVTISSAGLALELLAAAAAGAALTITLNAGARDAGWGAVAALLAVGTRTPAADLLGDEAAAFIAAMVVGLAGNLFDRVLHRSPLVFIVPGILLLVPGSLGFESAARLLSGDTIAGVDVGVDTVVTALAIVYGLVVSAALMPERRPAAGRPKAP